MPKRWSEEVKERAIALYLTGVKYDKIASETGVPQATLIYWLHERGIQPNRRKPANVDGSVTVDQLLVRLADSERKRGEVEAENRILRAKLDELQEGAVT